MNVEVDTWAQSAKCLNIQAKAANSNKKANGNSMNMPQSNQNQTQGQVNTRQAGGQGQAPCSPPRTRQFTADGQVRNGTGENLNMDGGRWH